MKRPTTKHTRRAMSGIAGAVAVAFLAAGAATPAQAQFNWFGLGEASAQDVLDSIAEHGFRMVGPLYRTGRVYVADVVDRRNRRERLIVSADSGQIVQRFFVDLGGPERGQVLAERPRVPRDTFFAHLQRGWDDDEPAPRPPLSLPAEPGTDPDQVVVPRMRQHSQPRVVTRTDVAPPSAAPVAPTPGPSGDPANAKPATGAVGAGRATTISNDPLRIPGTRRPDSAKPSPAAVATAKPPEPPPAKLETPPVAKPTPVKPAPTTPADVPVAPLD